MNTLIVGCGRVGAHLARVLEQEGHDVSILAEREGDLELLGAFAEAYCLTRLERGFQTLDFYRSLGGGIKEI